MRLLRLLVALLCLAIGVAIGALNPQPVALDLGATTLRLPLGVAILATLLIGVIIGGLILAVSVVLPLRQQLRRARIAQPTPVAPPDER